VLRSLADVRVVAHLSSDLARAETQASEFGGRAFTDLHRLLDQEQPDAAWICVTPDQHGALELALIDAGVPFFVEKPLSVDLATAERVAERLAAAELVVGVGYKFRALDTLPGVRQLLELTPARMAIGAWHDKMPPPVWWHQSARSGGQFVEQATHLVDLARYLLGAGSVVSALSARWPRPDAPDSDVPDVTAALLRFGEVPATFTATSLLAAKHAIHLQLICEGRVLTISEQSVLIDAASDRQELRTSADPFEVEDRAFVDAVRTRDPRLVLCSYADALETHRLCCAVRDFAADAPRSSA
jgi:predicted dehydrogenase